MIELPKVTISQTVLAELEVFQDEVDTLLTFLEKKNMAKTSYESKNIVGNSTFDAVKVGLTNMCSGVKRCVYCEDSAACEIEHIRPKSLYPENCFDWGNYIYICGACNRIKGDRFAVFDGESIEICKLSSKNLDDKTKGEDVLINPRKQNPMAFGLLDLSGSFKYVAIPNLSPNYSVRFEYTFETILNLNEEPRDFLRQSRKTAYKSYKSELKIYSYKKQGNCSQNELDETTKQIKNMNHHTVWKEMQRHYQQDWLKQIDEELHELFEESPEALNW
jgi:HNH endonuclease